MTGEPSRRKRGRPPHPDILTPREWQVLDLLRQDLTNEQIAQHLDISPATAKYHVSEILSKLNLTSREQAAAWQPEVVAVRWWQRATAWVPRRAWPLAGAAGALAAVGALAWIVLGASAGSDGDTEGGAVRGPTVSPSPVPTPIATPAPSPIVLGPVLTPLPSNAISEEGSYLVDLQTGQIWKTEGFGVWSPDGTKMFRTLCCSGESGFDVLDFATGTAARILQEQVYSAAWSPDGSYIAYSRFNGSNSENIYLVQAAGGESRKLIDLESTGGLLWSPSGNYLVTVPSPSGGNATLIRSATGEAVATLDAVKDLNWSPDRDVLAYAEPDGLFVLDVESGVTNQLTSLPTSSSLQWSPDGTHLLASIEGSDRVVSVDAPGEMITLPRGRFFTWSPDSKWIAYIGEGCTTNDWDVYIFSIADGAQTRVTSTPESPKEGLSWVNDNESVAYSTGSRLIVANTESLEERVLASVSSEEAGYLHYHPGLRGLRARGPSAAEGRYAGFGTSRSGHGLCD